MNCRGQEEKWKTRGTVDEGSKKKHDQQKSHRRRFSGQRIVEKPFFLVDEECQLYCRIVLNKKRIVKILDDIRV